MEFESSKTPPAFHLAAVPTRRFPRTVFGPGDHTLRVGPVLHPIQQLKPNTISAFFLPGVPIQLLFISTQVSSLHTFVDYSSHFVPTTGNPSSLFPPSTRFACPITELATEQENQPPLDIRHWQNRRQLQSQRAPRKHLQHPYPTWVPHNTVSTDYTCPINPRTRTRSQNFAPQDCPSFRLRHSPPLQ